MNQSELEIGDVIFYASPYLGIIEHTAIYLGTKNDIPYVIHATRTPYKTVMVTRLTPAVDFNYHVMRPTNTDLAVDAIVILLRWVEYQVPYASEHKTSQLFLMAEKQFSMELKSSEKEQAIFGKEHYKSNYFQYITMANALPYIPEKNGVIEGFGCAESVVSAFNIALFISHTTLNVSAGRNKWDIDQSNLEKFIDQLENPFPFDAKRALSAGLFEHCSSNPASWTDMGTLAVQQPLLFNEEDKELWREFKESLKARAHVLVNKLNTSSPSRAHQKLYTQYNSPLPSLSTSPSFSSVSSRSHSVNYIDVIAFAGSDPADAEVHALLDNVDMDARSEMASSVRTVRSLSLLSQSPLMMFFSSPKSKVSPTDIKLSPSCS